MHHAASLVVGGTLAAVRGVLEGPGGHAFTEDAGWVQSLELLVRPVAEWFAPDLVVSQHGADTHAWDPLTHMRLSTRAYVAQARLAHELSHSLAHGRWVAPGGGGYDWLRVVPRSWAITWAEMTGQALPDLLPSTWRDAWRQRADDAGLGELPRCFLDDPRSWTQAPRRAEIQRSNREHLSVACTVALPAAGRRLSHTP